MINEYNYQIKRTYRLEKKGKASNFYKITANYRYNII